MMAAFNIKVELGTGPVDSFSRFTRPDGLLERIDPPLVRDQTLERILSKNEEAAPRRIRTGSS